MKNIKVIVLDVDGTLTDGKIYLDNNGLESKAFNVKDGLAIAQAIKYGLEIVIITGRRSKIVEIRGKELGIKEIHQKVDDKEKRLHEILGRKNIAFNEVAYIGDDINDLKVMRMVGFSACPKDAAKEVKSEVDFISGHKGGNGAVRETLELILERKGIWEKIVNTYSGGCQ